MRDATEAVLVLHDRDAVHPAAVEERSTACAASWIAVARLARFTVPLPLQIRLKLHHRLLLMTREKVAVPIGHVLRRMTDVVTDLRKAETLACMSEWHAQEPAPATNSGSRSRGRLVLRGSPPCSCAGLRMSCRAEQMVGGALPSRTGDKYGTPAFCPRHPGDDSTSYRTSGTPASRRLFSSPRYRTQTSGGRFARMNEAALVIDVKLRGCRRHAVCRCGAIKPGLHLLDGQETLDERNQCLLIPLFARPPLRVLLGLLWRSRRPRRNPVGLLTAPEVRVEEVAALVEMRWKLVVQTHSSILIRNMAAVNNGFSDLASVLPRLESKSAGESCPPYPPSSLASSSTMRTLA